MGDPGNLPSSFCRGHFYALAKMMLTDTTMMSTKNVPTSSRGVAGSGCEFAGGLMCVGVTGASTETCTVTLVFQLVTAGVLGVSVGVFGMGWCRFRCLQTTSWPVVCFPLAVAAWGIHWLDEGMFRNESSI